MTRIRVPGSPGLCLTCLALLLLFPPSGFAAPGAVVVAGTSGTRSTFAIVYPIVHPFFQPVTEMALEYGNRRGVDLIFKAPEGSDASQQIRIVRDLIRMKVDGLALCPTDPRALEPLVAEARAAGIPVITFESDMPKSGRICFLGTDNYRAGRHLAEVLARELKDEGDAIVCTGLPTQPSLNQRIQGIRDVLREKYPRIRIVSLQSGEGNPDSTTKVIERQIREHPDFDSFTSIDATGGPAAVSIWKAMGWKGSKHKIVTFDDMPENLSGIRSGIIAAVISQREWTWGTLIIDRLLDIVEGKGVPEYTDTGTVEITFANIDSYRSQ